MPKFCFNWSLTGSTIIEAPSLTDARAQWDKIETNTDILASASSVTFGEDGCLTETEPGVFEEEGETLPDNWGRLTFSFEAAPGGDLNIPAIEPPDPSGDPNCAHRHPDGTSAFAYTGEAYGGDEPGEGRCYCLYCGADGDA